MTSIYIRKAEISDLPTIQRLLSTYFLDMEELKAEDFVLAEGEGKVLGCAALIRSGFSEKGFLEIHSIAIHPNFRGKGIGSRLVNHLISTSVGKDTELYVRTTAPAFFEKIGFVRIPDSEKLRLWEDCESCEHFESCTQHALKYRKNRE
ncbi:GNAT family N-acetyltransferase [Methanosarcina sp. MTP4]|uniref:GNAT family N-acetyltransferase n=1 Tax=Methanosarcina sp. MTP4 TaxID=1434100 RepID=UPI00064F2DD2|nr:GNAT family N-acetyltransferase [Methanosarcina sp. MTP4]